MEPQSLKLDYYASGVASRSVTAEVGMDDLLGIIRSENVRTLVEAVRAGNADAKKRLPALCYMGKSQNGKRSAATCLPTGLVMIDVDHCADPRGCWAHARERLGDIVVVAAHITPSGRGLRLVCRYRDKITDIARNIRSIAEQLELARFGDVDEVCKDLSRLSFLVPEEDWLLLTPELFQPYDPQELPAKEIPLSELFPTPDAAAEAAGRADPAPTKYAVTPDEAKAYAELSFRGHRVAEIIDKYRWFRWPESGAPHGGERHAEVLRMCYYFRHCADNDPKALTCLLPGFGYEKEHVWSIATNVCAKPYNLRKPKIFQEFLYKFGYESRGAGGNTDTIEEVSEDKDPYSELEALIDAMPAKLPPVFREYLRITPRYFKIPVVMALLPLLGTYATAYKAKYLDKRWHTTTFYTLIHAPSGSGKGFAEEMVNRLCWVLRNRDYFCNRIDRIYNRTMTTKASDKDAPDDPQCQLRLLTGNFSQPEMLQRMDNNHGMHMCCFAAELDYFRKGMTGQGNDKSDVFRMGYENSLYGQMFKSPNTFKGEVQIHINLLCTSTPHQIDKFFENCEDGLVSRFCYCDLGNQRFAKMAEWGEFSKREEMQIDRALLKLDKATYGENLDKDPEDYKDMPDREFKAEVGTSYQYKVNERKEVNMDWILEPIREWLDEKAEEAQRRLDDALDHYRRRVGNRGFRLALLCAALWGGELGRHRREVIEFVEWFMEVDLYGSMKLWALQYNKLRQEDEARVATESVKFPDIYEMLPDQFTAKELIDAANAANSSTPARMIKYTWLKRGLIAELEKGKFEKI